MKNPCFYIEFALALIGAIVIAAGVLVAINKPPKGK
jgi:hypothetical protein